MCVYKASSILNVLIPTSTVCSILHVCANDRKSGRIHASLLTKSIHVAGDFSVMLSVT